ncbi:MAG: hypothetical protein QOJ67_3501 [Acidimicrobiaceae bacterium]
MGWSRLHARWVQACARVSARHHQGSWVGVMSNAVVLMAPMLLAAMIRRFMAQVWVAASASAAMPVLIRSGGSKLNEILMKDSSLGSMVNRVPGR